MVIILTCALITLSFSQVVYLSPILNATQEYDVMQDEDNLELNFTNQLMEDIKARILKNLHRSEAPQTHVSLPPLQTLGSGEDWGIKRESASKKTITDFLYGDVENISCNGQRCWKIHFELRQQISSNDFQSAELWLYKKEDISEFFITHRISTNDEEGEAITTRVYNQSHQNGWTRFDVSHMVDVENITALEFRVFTDNTTFCLETEGDMVPFMLVHKDIPRSISKRSAIDCTNETSTCCRQKIYVTFKEMGWDSWVKEPQGYDINNCQGSCMGNTDLLINNRAQVMKALCENNPQKIRDFNKTECISCTPSEYRTVSIIYVDEENVRIVSHLRDMSIEKCGCA